jgi:hypothetical protein
MVQPLRAKDGQPGVRHDEQRTGDERDRGAGEQHFADRIARHQPFRRGARGREQGGGADHIENAERNMLAPLRLRRHHQVAAGRFSHATLARAGEGSAEEQSHERAARAPNAACECHRAGRGSTSAAKRAAVMAWQRCGWHSRMACQPFDHCDRGWAPGRRAHSGVLPVHGTRDHSNAARRLRRCDVELRLAEYLRQITDEH